MIVRQLCSQHKLMRGFMFKAILPINNAEGQLNKMKYQKEIKQDRMSQACHNGCLISVTCHTSKSKSYRKE